MNRLTLALIAIVFLGPPTLYFAWRSREFRKFLAGACFISRAVRRARAVSAGFLLKSMIDGF
jgi:hypothetical protein